MLVILRMKTREMFNRLLKILLTVLIFVIVISHLVNMYQGTNVISEGWLRDDRPSGNSMRVENKTDTDAVAAPGLLDQVIGELKGFYQKGE